MENLEEKYNRYAAMMRRHLETVRRARAYWSRGERRSGVSNKILPIREKYVSLQFENQ